VAIEVTQSETNPARVQSLAIGRAVQAIHSGALLEHLSVGYLKTTGRLRNRCRFDMLRSTFPCAIAPTGDGDNDDEEENA
jgi:hypothetical protein